MICSRGVSRWQPAITTQVCGLCASPDGWKEAAFAAIATALPAVACAAAAAFEATGVQALRQVGLELLLVLVAVVQLRRDIVELPHDLHHEVGPVLALLDSLVELLHGLVHNVPDV